MTEGIPRGSFIINRRERRCQLCGLERLIAKSEGSAQLTIASRTISRGPNHRVEVVKPQDLLPIGALRFYFAVEQHLPFSRISTLQLAWIWNTAMHSSGALDCRKLLRNLKPLLNCIARGILFVERNCCTLAYTSVLRSCFLSAETAISANQFPTSTRLAGNGERCSFYLNTSIPYQRLMSSLPLMAFCSDSCPCPMAKSVDTRIGLLMTIGSGMNCWRPKYSSPLPRCYGFYKTVGLLAFRPPLILFDFSLGRSATCAVRIPLHTRITVTESCTEHTRSN